MMMMMMMMMMMLQCKHYCFEVSLISIVHLSLSLLASVVYIRTSHAARSTPQVERHTLMLMRWRSPSLVVSAITQSLQGSSSEIWNNSAVARRQSLHLLCYSLFTPINHLPSSLWMKLMQPWTMLMSARFHPTFLEEALNRFNALSFHWKINSTPRLTPLLGFIEIRNWTAARLWHSTWRSMKSDRVRQRAENVTLFILNQKGEWRGESSLFERNCRVYVNHLGMDLPACVKWLWSGWCVLVCSIFDLRCLFYFNMK